jgi:hypothetical protein
MIGSGQRSDFRGGFPGGRREGRLVKHATCSLGDNRGRALAVLDDQPCSASGDRLRVQHVVGGRERDRDGGPAGDKSTHESPVATMGDDGVDAIEHGPLRHEPLDSDPIRETREGSGLDIIARRRDDMESSSAASPSSTAASSPSVRLKTVPSVAYTNGGSCGSSSQAGRAPGGTGGCTGRIQWAVAGKCSSPRAHHGGARTRRSHRSSWRHSGSRARPSRSRIPSICDPRAAAMIAVGGGVHSYVATGMPQASAASIAPTR